MLQPGRDIMETFEDFARRISEGCQEAAPGKIAAPPKATYKISCVCTGISFGDSCMVLGKSDLRLGKTSRTRMGLGKTSSTCMAMERK